MTITSRFTDLHLNSQWKAGALTVVLLGRKSLITIVV